MNQQEKNELELLVKRLFIQTRTEPDISGKKRIKKILKRSLHELALKDLLILAARMSVVMLMMLGLFMKTLQLRK